MNRRERSIAEVSLTEAQLERMRWIASLWTAGLLLCASVTLWDPPTLAGPVETQTALVPSSDEAL